jgi:hypothetical protein
MSASRGTRSRTARLRSSARWITHPGCPPWSKPWQVEDAVDPRPHHVRVPHHRGRLQDRPSRLTCEDLFEMPFEARRTTDQ